MEKREKIFLAIITLIILVGVVLAFIMSNSQKTPPNVLVQNVDRDSVEAVLGGYSWKVFGNDIIADSIDLKTREYSSENTIVSKPKGTITISSTEKFSVKEINYFDVNSKETYETAIRNVEFNTYFGTNAPELEGTYICLFKLEYSGKGTADYAVKVVVTDENVYDVKQIIEYKNTNILDISKINEILKSLPYSNKLNGVAIDADFQNININYREVEAEKEDLLNTSVALYVLIPELNNINYNTKNGNISYARNEVNNVMNRNVMEYAENTELWLKEVIYKEKDTNLQNEVTLYTTVISSSLSALSEKELGKCIAIDLSNNNFSGDILLNEYAKKELLFYLNLEYTNILLVDSDKFENTKGTNVIVSIDRKIDNQTYIVNVNVEDANKEKYTFTYKALITDNAVATETYMGESGDEV